MAFRVFLAKHQIQVFSLPNTEFKASFAQNQPVFLLSNFTFKVSFAQTFYWVSCQTLLLKFPLLKT
jgi:hypothetical protein